MRLLTVLRQQRADLDTTIRVLERMHETPAAAAKIAARVTGTPGGVRVYTGKRAKPRGLSVAARARISKAVKAYWAKKRAEAAK